MSQKLTLAVYLEGRGSVKSLTRIEAEAFGVPYPLISGWPARYGTMEITPDMLRDLARRAAGARRSTANKAIRAMRGLGEETLGLDFLSTSDEAKHTEDNHNSRFSGFKLRLARRRRIRVTFVIAR